MRFELPFREILLCLTFFIFISSSFSLSSAFNELEFVKGIDCAPALPCKKFNLANIEVPAIITV